MLLREPSEADGDELVALNRASRDFHHPWVAPPLDLVQYWEYRIRCNRDTARGYLLCLRETGAIVGVVNVSQIFLGNFRSAYLGYYGGAIYAKRGYMKEGLGLVLDACFHDIGLHRLEANIQPENIASLALVKSLGFIYEGFSRRYLQIDGEWRDHERWAILSDDWRKA